jgi:hypothetical protein
LNEFSNDFGPIKVVATNGNEPLFYIQISENLPPILSSHSLLTSEILFEKMNPGEMLLDSTCFH